MRARILLPLLTLGLGLAVLAATAAPVEQPDKPDADKIAKLVAQLGSDNFDEREKASADLETIGDPAYDALRQALKSTDEEVHKRAEILVGKIEERKESAEALKPKHVHLIYKDTPLTEALEDFNKQSGCSIVLGDPDGKLKDRKITLDTGDVTFWQALNQFCDKAGLQEYQSSSTAPTPIGGLRPGNGVAPGVPLVPQPIKIQPPNKNGAAAPCAARSANRRRLVRRSAGPAARQPSAAARTARRRRVPAGDHHRRPSARTWLRHAGRLRLHLPGGRQGRRVADRRLHCRARAGAAQGRPVRPGPGRRDADRPTPVDRAADAVAERGKSDDSQGGR